MAKGIKAVSIAAGLLIIIISLYGFSLLYGRLGLVPEVNLSALLRNKDIQVKMDGFQVRSMMDLEFILSRKRIRDETALFLQINGEGQKIQLVSYYTQTTFPTIYLVIGIFCAVIGFGVFLLRPEERRAWILYWGSMAFSAAIIISGGYFCLNGHPFTITPGVLFYLLYPLAPALLLHFSCTFSGATRRGTLFLIYLPAVIFAAALEITFILSVLGSSISMYRWYRTLFYFFRFFVLIYAFAAFVQFIFSYKKTESEGPRAQLKWILFGFAAGLSPFLFLYQFPQVLGLNPIISEELSAVFFIVIPLAFVFAIIKFKLMDIELIINKSLVYGFLTVFTVALYLFFVFILQNFLHSLLNIQGMAISALAAVAAASAFHPARKKIQTFVDKTFFRLSYDYQQTILDFNDRAQKMISRRHSVNYFLLKLEKVLPLDHSGLIIRNKHSSNATDAVRGKKVDLRNFGWMKDSMSKIFTKKGALNLDEGADFSFELQLEKKGLEIVIPLFLSRSKISGFLTLGKKMSGEKFNSEDMELVRTMTGILCVNLERISLQEEVIQEREEKEKLDELNRLKTEFISTVSHELRTPLSSIQIVTELLGSGKIKGDIKKEELLNLIAGESSRLSRLIHNILDFGKIEQRTKTYQFQETELCCFIQDTMKLLMPAMEKEKFTARLILPQEPVHVLIDRDAIKEALINLIDNAIKYSENKGEIKLVVINRADRVEIQVKDKGIGIPIEEQGKIFEKFYRHKEAVKLQPKGVGLGLKIVKHIAEAHEGAINVVSSPDQGSTFRLVLPKR